MPTLAPAPPPPLDDRAAPLFDDDFLETLEYLHIIARKILSGQLKAERRSRQKGVSVEFADHRPCSPGDDFRFIDSNGFFRTEQLFLKLFEEEEDLYIYLLLDCSGSVDFGQPYKFHYLRRLTAAIGYIVTTPKPTATVSLITERADPLLASWRFGLGKAAAFTSGAKAKWAADWVRWPGYGQFWAQVVRDVMRTSRNRGVEATIAVKGDQGRIQIDTADGTGNFLNGLTAGPTRETGLDSRVAAVASNRAWPLRNDVPDAGHGQLLVEDSPEPNGC